MKFILPVTLLAAAASAQSTTGCAAQNILEACLATTQSALDLCGTQDYSCLCQKYVDINTCFNNCPNDSRSSSFSNLQIQYCGVASQYPSTSTKVAAATGTTTAAATSTTGASKTEGTNSSPSSTETASGSETTKNSAADIVVSAGSILFAVAGVIAAIL